MISFFPYIRELPDDNIVVIENSKKKKKKGEWWKAITWENIISLGAALTLYETVD